MVHTVHPNSEVGGNFPPFFEFPPPFLGHFSAITNFQDLEEIWILPQLTETKQTLGLICQEQLIGSKEPL